MYSRKRVGPQIEELSGTPALIGHYNNDFPFRAKRSSLLLRSEEIWLKRLPDISCYKDLHTKLC